MPVSRSLENFNKAAFNYGENHTIFSINQSYNGSLAFRDKNTCRSDLRSRFR